METNLENFRLLTWESFGALRPYQTRNAPKPRSPKP